ncbi:MAG TPA: hypothetical protein VFY65_20330, partial [Longimicrobium sp.]|nr:hypothetical protein [Longimicrobium sp.]
MISRIAGKRLRTLATASTGRTSPPASSWRTPARSSSRSCTITWNSPAVSQSVVTRWRTRARPSASSEGLAPAIITSRPPFSSAPQISSVLASNETGAAWRMTSSAP